MSQNITLPTGRYVQGNPYKLQPKTDQNNNPSMGKDGKQIHTCFIAVAIPKRGEAAWWDSAWGKQILAVGAADMPQNYQHPTFAWKVEDGDSAVPNKRGKMNKDREGFPGNWIVKASSSMLPQFCTLLDPARPGKPVALMQEGAIQPGSYVQLNVGVAGNKRTDSPGIYVNPNIVCLVAYGPVIAFGMDMEDAGFGGDPLPPGASLTPVASMTPAAPTATPMAPAAHVPAPMATPPAPALAPAPVPVTPHTGITAPPAPIAPAPAPVPTGSKYNRTATWPAGVDDAGMEGAGWNEATLRQHGYIV